MIPHVPYANMKQLVFVAISLIAGALVSTANIQTRVQGEPGVDYPNYFSIPQTSFECEDQKYIPGFYADLETDCQVFHFCYKHRHESFLCPAGTTFNQPILACDNWYNSNCSIAPLYYIVNAGPGIESAGKNIPQLMRPKGSADSKTTDAAEVFEKISSFYETTTEKELLESVEKLATDLNAAEDDAIKQSENSSDIDDSRLPESSEIENNYLTDENRETDSAENFLDNGNVDKYEENYEQDDQDIIYDPDMNEYFGGNSVRDDYEDYQENVSDQFEEFYDNANRNDEDQLSFTNRENLNKFYPETDGLSGYMQTNTGYYDPVTGFSKRFLRETPRRYRRRPTYIVKDDNRYGYAQNINSFEPTVSPFEEPISIDTFAEINTELPDEYSFVENDRYEELADEEPQENDENYKADSDTNVDYKNSEKSNKERNLETNENSESVFNHRMLEEKNDYSEQSDSVYDQSDSFTSEDESEDIHIYDDSDNPVIQNINENTLAEDNQEDRFIVISDEIDSSVGEGSQLDNIERSLSEEKDQVNGESDDIYIYNDISESEEESSEGTNEETDVKYVYEDEVDEQYDQTRRPVYGYDPNGYPYVPQNYYRYVSDNGEVYENPELYDGSQSNYPEHVGIPPGYQQDSDVNYAENFYSHETSEQYPYDSEQPNIQQINLGRRYVPQHGYENQAGGLYSSNYGDQSEESESDIHYQDFSEQSDPDIQYQQYSEPESNIQYQEYFEQPQSDMQYQQFSRPESVQYPQYSEPESDVQYQQYTEPQSDVNYQQFSGPDSNGQYKQFSDPESSIQYEQYTESPEQYNQFQYTEAETSEDSDVEYQQYVEQSELENQYEYVTEGSEEEFSFQDNEFQNEDYTTELYNQYDDVAEDGTNSEEMDMESSEYSESERNERFIVIEDDESNEQVDEVEGRSDSDNESYEQVDEAGDSDSVKDSVDEVIAEGISESIDASQEEISDKIEDSEPIEVGKDSSFEVDIDKNSQPMNNLMPGEVFPSNFNTQNSIPVPGVQYVTPLQPALFPQSISAGREFQPQTEPQFLNNMQFPNSMDFAPFNFGSNMGQQFSVVDSSSQFSKKGSPLSDFAGDSDATRLSKLATFQERVRSMKGGKFGMFKKYLKAKKGLQ